MNSWECDDLRVRAEDQEQLIKFYENKIKTLTEENEALKEERFALICQISEGVFDK